MQLESPSPPDIIDVLRPHLSTNKNPGIDIAIMRIADRPDARNDACSLGMPAWANSAGAYC
jgi:hypothetical protein